MDRNFIRRLLQVKDPPGKIVFSRAEQMALKKSKGRAAIKAADTLSSQNHRLQNFRTRLLTEIRQALDRLLAEVEQLMHFPGLSPIRTGIDGHSHEDFFCQRKKFFKEGKLNRGKARITVQGDRAA